MEKNPSSLYRVRFGDCDPLGHLNNARYVDYFLNAREDHLRDHYQFDLKNFYAQGVSWVVGSHEILFRKPAFYNELVRISSTLIRATSDTLLVEMIMHNESAQHLKSICWTNFIHVSIRTGKKEAHAPTFMDFATSIEVPGIEIEKGIRVREQLLRSETIAQTIGG